MTRAEAVKKLRRLFGDTAAYRVDPRAGTEYERAAAMEELRTVVGVEYDATSKAMEARKVAILAADVEYQALKAKWQDLRKKKDALQSTMHHYKFTAGYIAHGFFHVDAQADTWEQVFTKLKEKYPSGKR